MGYVQVLPSLGMRIHVPSPWLTSLTKSVVRTVWAVDSGAKAVARPSKKNEGECIVTDKHT